MTNDIQRCILLVIGESIMESTFQSNLKKLSQKYSQKYIASQTNFSQSSINNYLSGTSEPSIQFVIALKEAFGISVDDFLFSDYQLDNQVSFDQFLGNYIIYYYNNSSYKGEVHTNIANTLNYGVLSIFKNNESDNNVKVLATFFKDKVSAVRTLRTLNTNINEISEEYSRLGNTYSGDISCTDQSLFLTLSNKDNYDKCYIILNNPPTKQNYIGGVGTVNSIARGREHNPCVQFIILSKKIIDVPDGELYNVLKFEDYTVNLDFAIKDTIELFKRLYAEKNELSSELSEAQKQAIVRNKLEYHFNDILSANTFRFAKVSNKEDDRIYKLIREGIDV